MIEPFKNYSNAASAALIALFGVLTCHRSIYTGLAACHGSACLLTDKPTLYAMMAALYSILAIRG